ncbi:MAG TPA: hypothetical protein VJK03_01285 [Candidatus Nanoarchaeia archaeon]|nr:hypothetical protein [Candidatus Nanoarchaeia archaeon]
MALDLNTEEENIRIDNVEIPFFRDFHGSYVKKAPEVKAAGRAIAPVYLIMERKANSPKSDWGNNYFHSGDGAAYPAKGAYERRRFKVVLDSQELTDITDDRELISGRLAISYEGVKGTEFNEGDAILDRDLKENEVTDHPVWLELFRGNRDLLGQVAQKIFKEGRDAYKYDKMMGIYLAGELATPSFGALVVDGLEDVRSGLDGRNYLGNGGGRLVGIAPEALKKPHQLVRPYTLADLEAFDNSVSGLDGVINPNLLSPIRQLRSKL